MESNPPMLRLPPIYPFPADVSCFRARAMANFHSADFLSPLIAPGSIPRSLLRTFNFEIWKLKCTHKGVAPPDDRAKPDSPD